MINSHEKKSISEQGHMSLYRIALVVYFIYAYSLHAAKAYDISDNYDMFRSLGCKDPNQKLGALGTSFMSAQVKKLKAEMDKIVVSTPPVIKFKDACIREINAAGENMQALLPKLCALVSELGADGGQTIEADVARTKAVGTTTQAKTTEVASTKPPPPTPSPTQTETPTPPAPQRTEVVETSPAPSPQPPTPIETRTMDPEAAKETANQAGSQANAGAAQADAQVSETDKKAKSTRQELLAQCQQRQTAAPSLAPQIQAECQRDEQAITQIAQLTKRKLSEISSDLKNTGTKFLTLENMAKTLLAGGAITGAVLLYKNNNKEKDDGHHENHTQISREPSTDSDEGEKKENPMRDEIMGVLD